MKTTKSMIFTPSAESRELYLYASNTAIIYHNSITPVAKSLKKHISKGQYNTEKAVTAFYHVMTAASDLYFHEFGYRFTVTERYTAAVEMEKEFSDNNFEM